MNIKVMDITPEIAALLLKGNANNRPLSKVYVDAYAEDMKSGEWCLNGESIKLLESEESENSKYILLDGQHRLAAVVKSGVTIKSLVVVFSNSDEAVKYVDNGRKRSYKDSIVMDDVSGSAAYMRNTVVIAVARYAIKKNTGMNAVSNARVHRYINDNKDQLEFIYNMLNKGGANIAGIRKAPVWAAVKAAYDSGFYLDRLCEWCEVFKSGESVSNIHFPIIRFRNWCISRADGGGGAAAQNEVYMRAQYSLKAFELRNSKAISKEATKEFYVLV